jgi:Holliday junction resolvase
MKRGGLFEAEFARSLRSFGESHPGFWWLRWPDYQDFVVLNPKLHAPQAPCDFAACYHGVFYAIECKSTRSNRFLMTWLKPHQRSDLLAIKAAGCEAYVAFSKRLRPVQCWLVDIADFLAIEKTSKEAGSKSVKFELISAVGVEVPRLRASFDMSALFERTKPRTLRGVKL